MPQARRPDECDSEAEHIRRMASQPDLTEESRLRLLAYGKVRWIIMSFEPMHGWVNCIYTSREKRVQSLSSMQVTSSTSSRDGEPLCIG